MIANFLASLKVMGLGMIGIFSVTIVLMVIMFALNKAFPPKKAENTDEDDD
ncbi:MAG: OadG-related small transporter subunit [Eubacterium sp.]|nr:OadG-related small transporter subunit [Eubacterium sp.]